MPNLATLTVRYGYVWTDFTKNGPGSYGSFSEPNPPTETGTAVAIPISGSFPFGNLPSGGALGGAWSISPVLQHINLQATAPWSNDADPNLKGTGAADGSLGSATINVTATSDDYITNTTGVALTLKFSWSIDVANLVYAGGSASYAELIVDDTANPNSSIVSQHVTVRTTGTTGMSFTYVIAAGHTLGVRQNFQFSGGSQWNWRAASSTPEGAPFLLDASNTAHTSIDELRADGTTVPGNPGLVFASGIDFSSPACFAEGTRIATRDGQCPVERIAPGMIVRTVSGWAPVVWVGRRHETCRGASNPRALWPVRIAANAFGPGQPTRPLYLSPDHAVFVDGVLVPIRHLLNGGSIRQEVRDAITYWHVELPDHDVLLAEGLRCESFLDTGNRRPRAASAADLWEAFACAPLHVGGAIPAAIRARLAIDANGSENGRMAIG